jgi:hypothetical protein
LSQEAQSVHVVPSLSTMVGSAARAALGSSEERRMSGRRRAGRWGAMWEGAEVGDGDGSGSGSVGE